jgi:hypothetical protein
MRVVEVVRALDVEVKQCLLEGLEEFLVLLCLLDENLLLSDEVVELVL